MASSSDFNQNDGKQNQLSDLFTKEELEESEQIEAKIKELNQKLGSIKQIGEKFNLTSSQQQYIEDPEGAKLNIEEIPTLDRRGYQVLTNEQIRQNYYNSYPFLNYFQIPHCKKNICSKVKFWSIMSIFISYFIEAKHSIENRQGLKGLRLKPFARKYFIFAGIGITFSLIESIFFDEICDINSVHYAVDFNRRKLIEDIKKKFKSA